MNPMQLSKRNRSNERPRRRLQLARVHDSDPVEQPLADPNAPQRAAAAARLAAGGRRALLLPIVRDARDRVKGQWRHRGRAVLSLLTAC